MRFIALAALAIMSVGLFGAGQASAAPKHCQGDYACKHAKKVAYKKSSYKKAAAYRAKQERAHKVSYKARKHVKYAQKPTRRAAAHRKSATRTASYGGGSNGVASYYWQGQQTASGARFNPNGMTAAHRSLPFGTRVLVTNQSNGRSVTVTINDRGPFIKGRIIDLSRGAASAIGMTGAGLARVSISVL